MKSRLLFAFYFAACFSPLAAQFNWQHTEGPNGGSQWNIWNNDQFAFYADEYFLYRTSDGINWEKFPENAIYPLGMRDSTLVGQFYQGNSFGYNQPSVLKISHNNGELWTQIDKPPVSYIQYIVVCDHGIYIPEGEKGIIHYSDDEGLTWD
ncbi:MAG: hypothetical protein KA165_13455, partial [Saprospiraceae bacterium]|nr:hypothetical protein [Saprospiraceae bacterium]